MIRADYLKNVIVTPNNLKFYVENTYKFCAYQKNTKHFKSAVQTFYSNTKNDTGHMMKRPKLVRYQIWRRLKEC